MGDAGGSGNYFPNDPRYFDVVVPAGHSLRLVVNSAAGTAATSVANYFIAAYSDTEYSEDFIPAIAAAAPEPATWATMLSGFALAGAALRGRRRRLLAA